MTHNIQVSKFLTEKETEEELVCITRVLEMPDGNRQSVTAFQIFWTLNDLIVKTGCLTQEDIIRMSWEQAQRRKVEFVKSFESVIAYTHKCLKKIKIRK